jgi:OOP family OmpA-OmpF porin
VPAAAEAPSAEKVTFEADTFFDFDKFTLKPAGKAKLEDLVSKLSGTDIEVVLATGHTDSVGSASYNQKLSVRRANAVKAFLVSKGIPADRIFTEGKGESKPVASNKSSEGRAKNRRVEVEVVGNRKK